MKTTVYSWRLSHERKAALEQVAHEQKRSVAELIDEAVSRWLERESDSGDDEETQARLRRSALRAIGQVAGGDPNRAEQARSRLRAKLRRGRSTLR